MTSFYEIDCPDLDPKPIDQAHLDEWVQGSGISEEIAQLNLQTLKGQDAINVITEEKISNLPGHAQQYATAPIARILKKFDHLSEGGWWCPGTPGNWGCFKPDNPRTDEKGKTIKYEHPLGQKTGVFYLNHPRRNYWEEIFDYPATHTIVITEGVKKAAALITAGVPAIALPGIWNGTPRVDNYVIVSGNCSHFVSEIPVIIETLTYFWLKRGVVVDSFLEFLSFGKKRLQSSINLFPSRGWVYHHVD
mgnify:CR=1 FL=1